jgi:hypothetical protein
MSSPQPISTPVRRFISIFLMLLLLAVFLSLYFFKYVPQQKSDYNKRAFTELKSVTDAFSGRDKACQQVVFWKQGKSADLITITSKDGSQYNLVYGVARTQYEQSRNLDSLMHLLTDGDRDIFDDYLMILEKTTARFSESAKDTVYAHQGDIVFNSGDLSMDYEVDIDTLLKKSDGFTAMNMYDARIEGNDYKLFLYPYAFHGQKLIMAGLVSLSHYTARFESAPIDLITTGSILLLLLLVAIPLLKIYIIGSHERIKTFDLRMIIGSYFVGGLVLFFLFAWNFLESVQTANNKLALKTLTTQLETNFCSEIDTACRQLRAYDKLYHDSPHIRALLANPNIGSGNLDTMTAMHPHYYRQFDDVFWINSAGKWLGRWGFKHFDTLPLIHVEDRPYFQDMKAGNVLSLKKYGDIFCLDPVLSKLDGKFVTNIVIRSAAGPTDATHPIMVGLSGAMYSVCNTVLPPGYGFSIVDRSGEILFNSKMDRSLLSNIYQEFPDQSTIQQYIKYRQERFFGSITLHGEQVALLVTPLIHLPYTVIVYHVLDAGQRFELHLLSLTSFFIGCIILFLILSAYSNEWGRTKPSFLAISQVGFDWLRPVPHKAKYYNYLFMGMCSLACCYGLAWIIIEECFHRHEFYLLSLSVLLPFYLAIFYFLLREKQKVLTRDPDAGHPPFSALAIPSLAIATITIYLLCGDPWGWSTWLSIGTQFCFAGLIWLFLKRFTDESDKSDLPEMLSRYTKAVITGVLLIVIVPAMGIFAIFFKEETRTRNKQESLAMASMMCERKDSIIKDKIHYTFNKKDTADNAFLLDLKFEKGVYLPDRADSGDSANSATSIPLHPPAMYYRLRNFLFPGDTTALTLGSDPERASDKSWLFAKEADSEVLYHYASWNRDSNRVRIPLPHNTHLTSLELLRLNAKNLSTINILLFMLTVFVLLMVFKRLTVSLATRIFLLGVLTKYKDEDCRNNMLTDATRAVPELDGLSPAGIRAYEEEDPGYRIMHLHTLLKYTYEKIWADLTPREKFVAYDFAIDSLANYKAGLPLHNLIRKGVLCVDDDEQLRFITHSFHNFVLNQAGNRVIRAQLKKAHEQGSWQRLRMPLFLLLSAVGIFVFLTQDAIYQKMTGLLTSVGALVPLISQFFNKSDK